MWTDKNDDRYSAVYNGTNARFYYEGQLQYQLKVRSVREARQMLSDWARLPYSPEQLQFCYQLCSEYVGATIDDITIEEGRYLINGKAIATI